MWPCSEAEQKGLCFMAQPQRARSTIRGHQPIWCPQYASPSGVQPHQAEGYTLKSEQPDKSLKDKS